MKNNSIQHRLIAPCIACALLLTPLLSKADVYHALTFMPTVVAERGTYIGKLSPNIKSPSGAKISNIIYSWNPTHEPTAVTLELCNTQAQRCEAISNATLATEAFNTLNADGEFYFKAVHPDGALAGDIPFDYVVSEVHVYWE